jgi:hypothetical protein
VARGKQKREELVQKDIQKDIQKENANIKENKIIVYNISQCHHYHSPQGKEDEKHT